MICTKCGKVFDDDKQDFCPWCKTVHSPKGEPVTDLKGVLCSLTRRFGREVLLDRRRTDSLIADIFPKETAVRRLCYVALYDGCARKMAAVRDKPFEARSAAAARCVKSLCDEIGLKTKTAAEAVEAVAAALGCDISFKTEPPPSAAETEGRKNITDSAEQYCLGRHFDNIREYDKALYWFVQSARQDYPEAEYYVGLYLAEGRGGEKNVNSASEWLQLAAEGGIPEAQYMLGAFLADGTAGVKDEQRAFDWFSAASQAGNKAAAEKIELYHETGSFSPQSSDDAQQSDNASPDSEDTPPAAAEKAEGETPSPDASGGEENYRLARRCLAEKDYRGAAMYYLKAAEQGHARAQCSYGKCLYLGNGVEKDFNAAFGWFLKAAEQGLDIALYNLGIMYLKGEGTQKNREQAVWYFRLAAEKGHAEAARVLDKLENSTR